jgi:hypothetical protein
VEWFRIVTDVQVSPHSLPALSAGRNVIRYMDSSPEERKLEISWKYRERDDNRPPAKIAGEVTPQSGVSLSSLTPTLRWKPAGDPNGNQTVTDYQVLVSLRPDARWPVAPYLHQSLESSKPEWTVPEGYLVRGTTYYWKVRARDDKSAVGPWSDIYSFTVVQNKSGVSSR